MTEKINWSYSMQVAGGPLLAAGDAITVEAYDKIKVTIEDNKTQKVDLAPSSSGAIQLVVINPAKPKAKLTYKVGSADVTIDGPHVLIGTGAVSLLGSAASSVEFTNKTGEAASIEILVGRDATP